MEINQAWFFDQKLPLEVWNYLIKPELIELWIMKSDFQAIVGHKFEFRHAPENESHYLDLTHCEVLVVEPLSKLSYTWQGSTKDRTFDSTIVWTLNLKENGTELHLRHYGFTLLEDVEAHQMGWDYCLSRLKEQISGVKS